MKDDLTPDQVLWARKVVREERKLGTPDADIETALKDALGTSIADAIKPRESDFWRGVANAVTLQHGDELAGLYGKLRGGDYEATRDNAREQQHEFEGAGNKRLSILTDIIGGALPALLMPSTGGASKVQNVASLMGGAGAVGAVEGEGRSEAKTAGGVAKDAAVSAVASALLAGAAHGVGTGVAKVAGRAADAVMPSRAIVREAATQLPKDATAVIARQEKLAPNTAVIGALTPELRALVRGVGSDAETGVLARTEAETRAAGIKTAKEAMGAKYDALQRQLPVDDALREIIAKTKTKRIKGNEIDFKALQEIRTKLLETGRASRMASVKKQNNGLAREITDWMAPHVPELKGLDADYAFLSGRGKAAGELVTEATNSSKNHAASRAYGAESGSIGGSLPQGSRGFAEMLAGLFTPDRAGRARAVHEMLLTPGDATQRALAEILQAQARLGAGGTGRKFSRTILGGLLAPVAGSRVPSLLEEP